MPARTGLALEALPDALGAEKAWTVHEISCPPASSGSDGPQPGPGELNHADCMQIVYICQIHVYVSNLNLSESSARDT